MKTKQQFYDEYADLLLQIALAEDLEREAEELTAEIEADVLSGNTEEEDAFFAAHEKQTLQLIDREIRKTHLRRFARHTLPKVGQVAAALLLVFFLGLTTAVATVHSVRVKVLELLIHVEEEYTELRLVENEDKSFDVPAEWKGSFYPSFIPSGFVAGDCQNMGADHSMTFVNDAKIFSFSEFGEQTILNIDTEDAQCRSKRMNGIEYFVSVKKQTVNIAWSFQEKYFIIEFVGSEDVALQVATSVQRVR